MQSEQKLRKLVRDVSSIVRDEGETSLEGDRVRAARITAVGEIVAGLVKRGVKEL